jgi:hypothetical protein
MSGYQRGTPRTQLSTRNPSRIPLPSRLRPRVRCHAHRKNGEQCKNFACHGLTVCRSHGGATQAAKAAAYRRLEAASIEAMLAGWLSWDRIVTQQRAADVRRLLGLPYRRGEQTAERRRAGP